MKKILMTLSLALCAAIAIPTAANAQSATTTTEKTAECCKDKKACAKEGETACAKEGAACAKEAGKACCKDGKGQQRLKKEGKALKADLSLIQISEPPRRA
ncbi:MAG: hypothetical protein K2L00_09975 [Muribaculaceae bacterium]|nr:hypothetical protein [Muribaculaceae bacterium]